MTIKAGPYRDQPLSQLAFYVNLHRSVIGPSATLTGRWRPDIDLRRMLTGIVVILFCFILRGLLNSIIRKILGTWDWSQSNVQLFRFLQKQYSFFCRMKMLISLHIWFFAFLIYIQAILFHHIFFLFLHFENTPIQIYRKFHLQNTEKFQIKKSDIFHISAQNIDCGYSLEPPRRGGSNEYPQSMFWAEIRKIMYTPVNPSFTI